MIPHSVDESWSRALAFVADCKFDVDSFGVELTVGGRVNPVLFENQQLVTLHLLAIHGLSAILACVRIKSGSQKVEVKKTLRRMI